MRRLISVDGLAFLFLFSMCWFGLRANPVPLVARIPAESGESRYRTVPVVPGILSNVVVTVTAAPHEPGRLFVVELPGRILSLSGPGRTNAEVFLQLWPRIFTEGEHGICSMALHPGYETNGQFFVFYSYLPDGSTNVYNRLSRFRVDPTNPGRALADSEEPLITQLHRSPVHNAGDMHFGADGYLYVSVGDEGFGFQWENAGRWDINFFSGVLRIDVDHREENLFPNPHPAVHPGTYRIPKDNPFLGRTNYVIGTEDFGINIRPEDIRGEFWAVGFRNPWRMSFDPESGDLYSNDVGVASREEVNVVRAGKHHGWFFKEGTMPWPFNVPATGLVDPIHEYEHTLGRVAITGGHFYRGSRYPELDGTYLFSDMTGQIYSMRRLQDGRHASPEQIAMNPFSVSIGRDPLDGSILVGGVGLSRLERVASTADPLPEKLSETGLFSSIRRLAPAPGLVSYEVNQPFWSDHAIKSRWFGVPTEGATVTFHPDRPWEAATGTVWVKHFDFGLSDVDSSLKRRLETRLMVKTSDGVYGATYRWNEEQTDAVLVESTGAEEDLVIATATGTRTQRWRYPSRTECLSCHTAMGGHALSFNTAQLNRPGSDGTNQLMALRNAGYFTGSPLIQPNLLPAHPALDDETASVESRVRSYLEVNCSQCHQPNGPTRSPWDSRTATPLAGARIVGEPAVHQIENGGVKIVDPGKLVTSILYRRVAEFGPLHMPPLGTFVTNTQAVALLRRWVTNDLPRRPSFSAWVKEHFPEEHEALGDAELDPDEDGDSNLHEFLVGTDPMEASDHWKVRMQANAAGAVSLTYRRSANRRFTVEMSAGMSGPWTPLDVPENRPWQAAEESDVSVALPPGLGVRFFRVNVVEP